MHGTTQVRVKMPDVRKFNKALALFGASPVELIDSEDEIAQIINQPDGPPSLPVRMVR
jgi:hypothetical protein